MIAGTVAAIRQRVSDRRERPFVLALVALTVLSAYSRATGLSHGALFRDDAWVALTRRVPLHVAWHMVGTAPGFVLFERFWVGLSAPSTWWAQIPTFVVATLTIPLLALAARWFGLKAPAALLASTLLAISRIDLQYATHLKPYASDVLVALGVLVTSEMYRRGRSAWPFAITSLAATALSFTVAPLVIGVAAVVAFTSWRTQRTRTLLAPMAVLILPLIALYLAVRSGISPRLRQSWAPNFVQYSSLRAVGHSVWSITSGLVAGFSDTTPHWHIPGLSKLILAYLIIAALYGAWRARGALSAPWSAAVVVALLFSAMHIAPLGTGRTDAYLYAALALLVAYGTEGAAYWLAEKQLLLSRVAVGALIGFALFGLIDRTDYPARYPGGSFTAVANAARAELSQPTGSVLIEGTARWPWTYYDPAPVRLTFSPRYNTGFAPLSSDPRVVVMAGTVIEGGYSAKGAISKLANATTTVYVRSDDWPSLGDPVANALRAHCWHVTKRSHPAGYLLEWLRHDCATP